jgi:hypothetical protein
MAAKHETNMNRLNSFEEWIKFVRNGAIVALVVAILLFRNSPHDPEEIALTIVIPLVIFNCIPFILVGILDSIRRLRPQIPQQSLPLSQSPPVQTKAVPLKYRLFAYALIGTIIGFSAGLAILLGSFAYDSFYVSWAIVPARHLSYALLGISILPIVALLSFVAGNYYQGKLRGSGLFHWVSRTVTHPLNYWPTTG